MATKILIQRKHYVHPFTWRVILRWDFGRLQWLYILEVGYVLLGRCAVSVQLPLDHKQNLSLLPIQVVDSASGVMQTHIVGFHLFQSKNIIVRLKAGESELSVLPKCITVQAILHSSGPGGWLIVAACYINMCLWELNLLWLLSCYLPILSGCQRMVYCVWMLTYFLARWCLGDKWNLGVDVIIHWLFPLCGILLAFVVRLVPDVS